MENCFFQNDLMALCAWFRRRESQVGAVILEKE
jgi:hypothetical protein